MTNDDVKKLLGGYATGTLTEAEQKALFDAALQDQSIFEALADEQGLKDILDEPSNRAEVLAALDAVPGRTRWWRWLPACGAVAGVVIVASIAIRLTPVGERKPAPHVSELRPAGAIHMAAPPVPPQTAAQALSSVPRTKSIAQQPVERAGGTTHELSQGRSPVRAAAPNAPPAAVDDQLQASANTASPSPPGNISRMAAGRSLSPPSEPAATGTAGQTAVTADNAQSAAEAKPAAKFTSQVSDNDRTLSATVLRRGADGLFRPADAVTTFKPGETVRLQVAGTPRAMITIIGTLGDSRQPVFSGRIPDEGSLFVPVQLAAKDTQLRVVLSSSAYPVVSTFHSVTGPAITAMPESGVLAGGSTLSDQPTSRRAVKKSQMSKEDADEKAAVGAKAAAAPLAQPTTLTLNLTLKVQ